ncbi:hypothetical protein DYQ86_10815 [Acidobacteria bacterium AB60]|nr:hypothetical protein DYQ86_10815 [Acidobacteria bacterium AB60]
MPGMMKGLPRFLAGEAPTYVLVETLTKSTLILMATAGCLWCGQAHAVGVPRFEVKELVNSADLIVIVDVTTVRTMGAGAPLPFGDRLLPANRYSADLSVRSTLKGRPLEEVSVTYELPEEFVGYSGLREGIRMVFLRRDNGQYHLANPYYSNFPASRELASREAQSKDISEVVLSKMLAVLASPTSTASEKREILRVDYALPSNDETTAAVRKGLSDSSDRWLSEKLRGELIRFGDLSQLPEVANLLSHDLATQDGRGWLLYVVGNCIKDPRAVPAMEPLLHSPVDAVREAAVEALWHMAVPAVVPALVAKLDDPDEKVQFYAVRGLSDIANEYGWGGPSEGEFHDHREKYLSHWRAWAGSQAR